MTVSSLPTVKKYHRHLGVTADWLLRSVAKGRGGSCAHFSPLRGWSKPYPETTGYLIPTLLAMEPWLPNRGLARTAEQLGQWLLSIQFEDGAWQGGLYHPGVSARASVFNTGQILKGMAGLYRATQDSRWLDAALRGAGWLAGGVNEQGQWGHRDYMADTTPSYYTHVAWPMLEVWKLTQDQKLRDAADRVLRFVVSRRQPNGTFLGWGFTEAGPAFTHTIAYTLRGLLEAARLTGDWSAYGEPAVDALEWLRRRADLTGGRLSGAYDQDWKPTRWYSCLTGNVQIAICLLEWESRVHDLRIVNAAAKLTDYVCAAQSIRSVWPSIRGAVGGSKPLYGRYITLRYPNWAAKYHCDALMRLITRIEAESEASPCD